MPKKGWTEKAKNVVEYDLPFSGTRGTILSADADIQELIAFLNTALPASQVNPNETLTGRIHLRGEIDRS